MFYLASTKSVEVLVSLSEPMSRGFGLVFGSAATRIVVCISLALAAPAMAAEGPFPAPDVDFQGVWVRTDRSAQPLPVHYSAKIERANFDLPNGDHVLRNVTYGVSWIYGPSLPKVIIQMPIHRVVKATGHPTNVHRRVDGVRCRVWRRVRFGNHARLCLAEHHIPLTYQSQSRSYKLKSLDVKQQGPDLFKVPNGLKIIRGGRLLARFDDVLRTPF